MPCFYIVKIKRGAQGSPFRFSAINITERLVLQLVLLLEQVQLELRQQQEQQEQRLQQLVLEQLLPLFHKQQVKEQLDLEQLTSSLISPFRFHTHLQHCRQVPLLRLLYPFLP
jgi:hypothetical protein